MSATFLNNAQTVSRSLIFSSKIQVSTEVGSTPVIGLNEAILQYVTVSMSIVKLRQQVKWCQELYASIDNIRGSVFNAVVQR